MAQTPAERRKAQRALARDLKAHKKILPESITRAARTRGQVVRDIQRFKNERFGARPAFNQRRSDKNVKFDTDGNERSIETLRKIERVLARARMEDDYSAIYFDLAADETDLESALYYK